MIFKRFQEDIDSFLARDPAARSRLEVALCYPGYHALMFYRLSHPLWKHNWRLLSRWISQLGKFLTGIEIHPGAGIGRRFVIDHGNSVVIGETSLIGDDVTMYQGVTLGGIAPSVDSKSQINRKRHPTVLDGAIIGSGAQVLGPITVGKGARVGANAVVTKDVPPGVTAVGIPARVVMPKDKKKAKDFVAYGTPTGDCPDPVVQTINNLRGQVETLMDNVDALEKRLGESLSPGNKKSARKSTANDAKKPIAVSGRGS